MDNQLIRLMEKPEFLDRLEECLDDIDNGRVIEWKDETSQS